ncbi:MAG TPA: DegT/DnrJ/EryC1/StrS family aminotransferase, partial [bacterium]|nr:DegT/DnrJ/EryC1/StrS family aminotransferase [bacterium]
IQDRRRAIWFRYRDGLRDWAAAAGARLPVVPDHCRSSYHLFHLLLPSAAARDALIGHLRSRRICSVFHYLPLHLSPMGRRYGGREGDCPVTEDVSARLLRLPFFTGLEEREQKLVIAAVREFKP